MKILDEKQAATYVKLTLALGAQQSDRAAEAILDSRLDFYDLAFEESPSLNEDAAYMEVEDFVDNIVKVIEASSDVLVSRLIAEAFLMQS